MKLQFTLKELVTYIAVLFSWDCLSLVLLYRPQLKYWLEPAYREGDFRTHFYAHEKEVHSQAILYGTSWCRYCAQARQYFRTHEIKFIDLDIENSQLAKQQYSTFVTDSIPVVLIGQRRIDGFKPDEYAKALMASGSKRGN